jgi:hypothetical protein
MKNSRLLILFLMVFVILAALLAFQSFQRTANPPATAIPRLFTGVTVDAIQAIRLRAPETGESLVISRADDGSWTAPELSGTLDAAEAENIARTMVLLPYHRTLPLNPDADLTAYGFTPQGILGIEIVLSNGNTHAVAVGFRTPTENAYYALVDDRPDLYLIDRFPIDFLISRLKNPPTA